MNNNEKNILKELKSINKRARSIFAEMKKTNDPQTCAQLQKEFDENQAEFDEVWRSAETVLIKNSTATIPEDEITLDQAQNVWNSIRENIRLAKFNDSGIELPDICMAKLFKDRKSVRWQDINAEVQSIIDKWEPAVV